MAGTLSCKIVCISFSIRVMEILPGMDNSIYTCAREQKVILIKQAKKNNLKQIKYNFSTLQAKTLALPKIAKTTKPLQHFAFLNYPLIYYTTY